MADRLPNLPADIPRNHHVLASRGRGRCGYLRGKVLLYIVRVSDAEAQWNDAVKAQFNNHVQDCLQWASKESAAYPHPVQLSAVYRDVRISNAFDFKNAFQRDKLLYKLDGVANAAELQLTVRRKYHVDSVALVFAFNYSLRGHAYAADVAFIDSGMNEISYISATDIKRPVLIHEVFHQYGAEDFYYPPAYVNACQKHFGESIMLHTSRKVDPLTAYLIGWTDTPSAAAVAFLRDTASVTREEVIEARRKS